MTGGQTSKDEWSLIINIDDQLCLTRFQIQLNFTESFPLHSHHARSKSPNKAEHQQLHNVSRNHDGYILTVCLFHEKATQRLPSNIGPLFYGHSFIRLSWTVLIHSFMLV
ncbi:Nitrogen assimilation transcription factor nit-4 [Fusarium oxysporum f. sp. albedinis]|nr:Nitrogen assimilation transcription factor nit-4 [Fusarium oxysporum f. sp. albedinis]